MSIQKAEMSVEQIENGQIVEHVAYPFVEYEHVAMENGMDIMSMIRDDVSTPTVTHDTSSFKAGQGDSDVSESIVDSSIASMTIKGQTYQNILPSPSLRNGITNGKTMQKLNEGYDSVNTVDGSVKSAILKGCTGYRDIDTGEILETFEEGRNLELVSVKMPVLTTTGKNLWNPNFVVGKKINDNGEVELANGHACLENYISVLPNKTYHISNSFTANGVKIFKYDNEKRLVSTSWAGSLKLTTESNVKYIRYSGILGGGGNTTEEWMKVFQLEEGSTSTSYEPFKSNILSTPEDVVLRSLPNGVKDTLNLNTGEYVQRIGEITLNGSETNWSVTNQAGWESTPNTIAFGQSFTPRAKAYSASEMSSVICDKFATITANGTWGAGGRDEAGVSINQNSRFDIRIERTKLSDEGLTAFKQWLSQNPITVQYEFETPIVKTVDLSILDQDNQPTTQLNSFANGYIQVSSQGLIPSVDYEVPTSNSYHVDLMKPNTQYTMKNMQGTFTIDNIQYNASTNGTFTSPSALTNNFMITSVAQSQPMLLEGDVREKDIPYFKGIKSAFEDKSKIEVLSTNHNLWTGVDNYANNGATIILKDENECVFEHHAVNNGIRVEVSDYEYQVITMSYDFEILDGKALNVGGHNRHQTKAYYIDGVKVGTNYHNGYVTTYEKNRVYHVDHVVHINLPIAEGMIGDREYISIEPNRYLADTPTYCKMRVTNFQITLGDVIKEYKAPKSNSTKIPLLSPLRSLPNGVRDEIVLDRMSNKAKLIQRVGSVVLDGSFGVPSQTLGDYFISYYGVSDVKKVNGGNVYCDKFKSHGQIWAGGQEGVSTFSNSTIWLSIYSKKLEASNIDGMKKWLSQNPVTVYYELETPVITEVNLEGYPYVYKGGHIFLNTDIAPTTEVAYSINQAHQIESSNEDILRHQNEINHLYELIAQYVQVQYEAELIDIALQG